MRISLTIIATLCLLGCPPSTTPTVEDTSGPSPTTATVDTATTSLFTGNQDEVQAFGYISIGRVEAAPGFEATNYAFADIWDVDMGVVNLAAFHTGFGVVSAFPAPGESLEVGPLTLPASFNQVDIGELVVGNTTMDSTGNLPHYVGTPETEDLAAGPGSLSFAGSLPPYTNDDAYPKTEPTVLLTPDPTQPARFTGDEELTLTWEAGGNSSVYLEVGDTILGLEDSGTASLTVEDLGLTGPVSVTTAFLSRQTLTTVETPVEKGDGVHTFIVQSRSDQPIAVEYIDTELVTELAEGQYLTDDCPGTSDPLPEGQYYGTLAANTNSVELAKNNGAFNSATPGHDGFVKVPLQEGDTLVVTFAQYLTPGAVYLLNETCDATMPLDGESDGTTDLQTFIYNAPQAETVVLALDGVNADEGGLFYLLTDVIGQ